MGRSWRGYRPLSPSNSSFPLTYWDRLYTPFQTGITPKLSLEGTMPEDSVNCRLLLVKRYE